jgi:hypothetical protein
MLYVLSVVALNDLLDGLAVWGTVVHNDDLFITAVLCLCYGLQALI